jgi:hypothetical protein
MISEVNEAAIEAIAERFLAQYGDRFAFVSHRWWHLGEDGRWRREGARFAAILLIKKLAAWYPPLPQYAWIKKQANKNSGLNMILAHLSNRLFLDGLLGPTPPSAPPAP